MGSPPPNSKLKNNLICHDFFNVFFVPHFRRRPAQDKFMKMGAAWLPVQPSSKALSEHTRATAHRASLDRQRLRPVQRSRAHLVVEVRRRSIYTITFDVSSTTRPAIRRVLETAAMVLYVCKSQSERTCFSDMEEDERVNSLVGEITIRHCPDSVHWPWI